MPRKGTMHFEYFDHPSEAIKVDDLTAAWEDKNLSEKIMAAVRITFIEEDGYHRVLKDSTSTKSLKVEDRVPLPTDMIRTQLRPPEPQALLAPVQQYVLILTVGLPRSGKSTWARQQGYPIVNPDAIRLAIHGQAFLAKMEWLVWNIAYLMVEALFETGHKVVIVDATNISKKRREEWFKRFDNEKSSVSTKVFPTSPAECIKRARAGGREDLIPVIKRMTDEWDQPLPDEWCNIQGDGSCISEYRCMHSVQPRAKP